MSLHFVKPYHKHLIKTSFLLSSLLWGMIPGSIHTVCAKTAETDQQLSQTDSHTVAIDPGHQGPNVDMSALEPLGPGSTEMKAKASTGTQGAFTGLEEYQLNLDVSLKLPTLMLLPSMNSPICFPSVFWTPTARQPDLTTGELPMRII